LIFASIIAIFIYGMIAAMLGTILPDLSIRFKLSPSQNGTIAFAQALGLIIASVSVGPLLDDEGKKVGIVLGLALIAIALSMLPRAAGYRSILILLFLLGIGGGTLVTGANSLASDAGEMHRAGALNLANLFFGLGALATPFIAANLFKQNWIRLCYTITSRRWRTIRPRRCRSRLGPSFALHDRTLSLPLHHLRGGSLELAASASDRARHP
jgi:fucose permease